MDFLYQQLIAGKQKAIAGWLGAALATFLVKHGISLPNDAGEVFSSLLWGLFGLIPVYLKRNK